MSGYVTLDTTQKTSQKTNKNGELFISESLRPNAGWCDKMGLTNTYFTGEAPGYKRGRSKQKRNDCPLVAMGLILDEKGFVKGSRIFEGNVSEPSTLLSMVEGIHKQTKGEMPPLFAAKPTVVMDDGIASKENIALLKAKGFFYPEQITYEGFAEIKEGVKARRIRQADEVFLHCVSDGKMKKEKALVTKAGWSKNLQKFAMVLEKRVV